MQASLLRLDSISKSFPGVRALDRISLDIQAGQIVAIVGEKATVFQRREADYNFHQKICQASGMRVLAVTMEPLIRKVLLITTVAFRYGRASRSFEEHQQILAALRQRDEKAAVKALKLHLRNARKFNSAIWDPR